jgi:hypothetical protein
MTRPGLLETGDRRSRSFAGSVSGLQNEQAKPADAGA